MLSKKVKVIKIHLLAVLLMIISSCSEKNHKIAYSAKESNKRAIYLTTTEGELKTKLTNSIKNDGYPAGSPDGKSIAFYGKYDKRKTWSIHSINIDGTNAKRLTHAKNKWDSSPTWSPDGKKIAFAREYRDTEGKWIEEIWIMNSDGSEQHQIKSLNGGGPSFMPDGRILFHSKSEFSEICIADSDGSNIITLTNNSAEDWYPEVSPDGKQITFMSDRDEKKEIYIMNIDGSNQKRLTFNDVDDWNPSWSPDGSTIIFASETDEYFDIYMINKDGSSVKKIIDNGSQASWLK
ncbi:MAG: PD40 domain-containing protein [Flavobacteriaceae bacterium]|nr:PD40 domain-containing protein [Flavobacteriaceae bacterium]